MSARGLGELLGTATVDAEVSDLRPDYVAVLVAADGLPGGPSDDASEAWLREAEAVAKSRLAGSAPEDRPHVALWRDAYRAFGAKPQRTRNSLEPLLRRAQDGLPRINRLTDLERLPEFNKGGYPRECSGGPPHHGQRGSSSGTADAGTICETRMPMQAGCLA